MKASSESGEWASLTSSAFPVAGFGGIAFCQLSLRARAARAVPPRRAGFPVAIRLAKWRALAGEWRVGDLWPDRIFDSFLSPKKPLWGQSGLLVRQVLWSRRNPGMTPVQQRVASDADSASAETRLQDQNGITLRPAEQSQLGVAISPRFSTVCKLLSDLNQIVLDIRSRRTVLTSQIQSRILFSCVRQG